MSKTRAEYGKRCESCHKFTRARMYNRPTMGVSGGLKNQMRWRRLCQICWDMASENQI